MIDTLIVAVVLCVDTCEHHSVKNRIETARREINIREKVIRAVLEQQEQDRESRKPYWHLKRTYILHPKELRENQNKGIYNSNKNKNGN